MEKLADAPSRRRKPTQAVAAFLQDRVVEHLTHHRGLLSLYDEVQTQDGPNFVERLLRTVAVDVAVSDADLTKIPVEGPVLAVSNHPFGLLDGAMLAAVLLRARPDMRLLANHLLAGIREMREFTIYVDAIEEASQSNARSLKQALRWLHLGGVLGTFPAGEVSHWDFRERRVADPAWSRSVGWLARHSGATVVPIFFNGQNSLPFQALGLIHSSLRTMRLPRELMNKRGRSVEVRIGTPLTPAMLEGLGDDEQVTEYLRWRTYLLAERGGRERVFLPGLPRAHARKEQPIAAAVPTTTLAEELRALPGEQCLARHQQFSVYLGRAEQMPNLLQEIGRLRETTFRLVGEGTGRSVDLDRFDARYLHLFVWDEDERKIVGAYRLGHIPTLLAQSGVRGLYTSTLFHYSPRLFQQIEPAWELGRSFVRPEYQKQYAPLMLLWKGIATHAAANPATPLLVGAVSISSHYSRRSRELLVRFLECGRGSDVAAGLIRPRRPFAQHGRKRADSRFVTTYLRDIDDVSGIVEDLEEDGKSVPILLKHYVRLGGRFLGFNLDPDFGNALDGLVLVDLRQTEPAVLTRYMGREAYAAFCRYHGLKVRSAAGKKDES
jgi:putative hemolysin